MENLVLVFIVSSVVSLSTYFVDVTRNNSELSSLMKVVWGLTIVYSGVLGLAIYWYSGRKQIRTDSIYQ